MNKKRFFVWLPKHWEKFALAFFVISYIVVFSVLSILRHKAFASGYDLANMGQTVWSVFAGQPFTLSGVEGTISRFSIHADIILALLSPFYLIYEHIETILVIQSIILGLGGLPVYAIAFFLIKDLKIFRVWQAKSISLGFVVIYLLNPGMQWTNIYDFHGVSMAITFLLAAFYFVLIRRWVGYICFVLLALLTKEQISLFIFMLGLIVAFVFRAKRIGIITSLLGLAWFVIMVFVVIPNYSESGKYWALDWLTLRNAGTGAFSLPNFHELLQRYIISPDAILYYGNLLKPFSFLPLLGLPWMILSLPEILINLFSSQAQMRSFYFHYDSGVVPSLMIASIYGFRYIVLGIQKIRGKFVFLSKAQLVWIAAPMLVGVLMISIRVNYHYSPLPTTPSCWCLMYQVSDEDREFAKVLKSIPENATVTASSEVRAHLTERADAFNLPNATDSAQYIAILDQNRIVGDYRPKEFEMQLIKVLKHSKEHILIYSSEHFFLFKKID